MQVTVLYFDGCQSWQTADERLQALAGKLGFELAYRQVETPELAAELEFRGSPTILVDGQDPFAVGDELFGLSCRIYQTPDGPAGSPTVEQLRRAIHGESGFGIGRGGADV